MFSPALLGLLPALALLTTPSFAQVTGSFALNASIPESNPVGSGCVILAQLTPATGFGAEAVPPILQALVPVCHPQTPLPSMPKEGLKVNWPIANNAGDGEGLKSELVIYGQVEHKAERTDINMAQAGCVMRLSSDQAQYLLGRSLTWNNGLQQLWDNTGDGFILNPEGNARAVCGKDESLLPSSLWLPDPYIVGEADGVWQTPIEITVRKAPEPVPMPVPTPEPSPAGNDTAPVPTPTLSGGDDGVVGIQTVPNPSESASATGSASAAESFSGSPAPAPMPTPSPSADASPAASPSPSAPSGLVVGGLVVVPSDSASASPSPSSSAGPAASDPAISSPTAIAAIQTNCAPAEVSVSVSVTTVTEVWTSTVTAAAEASVVKRRGIRMFY